MTLFKVKIRPWSFDSWDGRSTDTLKKAAVGKEIGKNFAEILKSHIFASIQGLLGVGLYLLVLFVYPTDRLLENPL